LALIREEVQGGESFAGAIGSHKNVFPIEYIHLVRAGEMAGELDTVLNRLADDLEGRMNRRARIRAALAYPAFMSVVGVSVVLFLLTFIVPTLVGLFENLEAALPWPTRILLAVSGIMHDYWWLVLPGVVAAIMLIRRLFKNPARYRKFEVLVFRLGPIGSLIQKMRLARAFRSLAIMLAGGVPLTTALNITAQGLGRSSFGAALENAAELVGQGRSLTEGLEGRLFPPVARRMISVGESSGSLDVMLDRVAKTYEDETDRSLSTLTSLVEPAIILFMGVLVLFIVLAVLLPIFDLSGLVG
jgi:general secretion pathway protein F